MASMCKVLLIGNCGKDPEIRDTANNQKMATFSLATNERWKDKSGEQQERSEWHNIVVFGDWMVEFVEKYIHAGSKLYVEGKIKSSTYEKDGIERKSIQIAVDGFKGGIELLDSKKDSNAPF